MCCLQKGQLLLLQNDEDKAGLAEELPLHCNSCKYDTLFFTSAKVSNGSFEVGLSKRSALAAQGYGEVCLPHLCALIDLPPAAWKKTYNDHMKQIVVQATKNADIVISEAIER